MVMVILQHMVIVERDQGHSKTNQYRLSLGNGMLMFGPISELPAIPPTWTGSEMNFFSFFFLTATQKLYLPVLKCMH